MSCKRIKYDQKGRLIKLETEIGIINEFKYNKENPNKRTRKTYTKDSGFFKNIYTDNSCIHQVYDNEFNIWQDYHSIEEGEIYFSEKKYDQYFREIYTKRINKIKETSYESFIFYPKTNKGYIQLETYNDVKNILFKVDEKLINYWKNKI
jgi:hypothetical protein